MSQLDFPLYEVKMTAAEKIEEGYTVHQKFTCEKCKTRQHTEVPNKFYELAICEVCRHVTDIKKTGCNYMAMKGLPPQCPRCGQRGFHKIWCQRVQH